MPSRPQLLLVVGIGRSGTSAFSGTVAELGYAVPQPEIKADETNPRGFGEPSWAVHFHNALLRGPRVGNFDARPYAWRLTRAAGEEPEPLEKLRAWLTTQFEEHDRVIVKDPRTAWFLPLWSQVSDDLGLDTSYVTLLRPPAEVVASAGRWYTASHHEASRLGGWINVQLRTERQTRESKRAFVRYSDLLADWRSVLKRLDSSLGLRLELGDQAATARVDAWLDPGLRREQGTLADMDVPAALRSLTEQVWNELDGAATKDDRARQARLDQLRASYRRLYLDAEQIARSSIVAARHKPAGRAKPGAGTPTSEATAAAEAEADEDADPAGQ